MASALEKGVMEAAPLNKSNKSLTDIIKRL